MSDLDPLILDVIARTDRLERSMRDARRQFVTEGDRMQRANIDLRRRVETNNGAIGASFRSMAASLAAGFSAQQVAQLADSYTRFTNQLKVAGLEGENLGGVQEKLFVSAQRYGVGLESLGTLFGRLQQAGTELGATQTDLLRFTNGVAAALKIQGGTAAETQGALLQLSQALGSEIVRAEEFNSINEGARPILQAVANGIDRFGGSVSKLRREVIEGNVTSREFYQGFLDGSGKLEAQALKANLTIGASFMVLTNAITKFVGEADQANGATATISTALVTLANNLDTVTEALSVIAVIMGGRLVAGMVAGAVATGGASAAIFALQARAAGAATTIEALAFTGAATGRTLLAAFGGPVGLAVTALTLGIGYLASADADAQAAATSLTQSIDAQAAAFAATTQRQNEAKAASDNLTATQRTALTATANLTGEAKLLAEAWGRVAAQAKVAAIEQANAAAVTARTNRQQAEAAVRTRQTTERSRPSNQSGGGPTGAIGRVVRAGVDLFQPSNRAERAAAAQAERQQLDTARENERIAQQSLREVQQQRLAEFKPAPLPTPTGKPTKPGRTRAGRQGPDTDAIARRFLDDLEQGQLAIKQAEADAIGTTEARRSVEADRVEIERRSNARAIEADDDLNRAQKDQQLALNDRVAEAQRQAINAEALTEAQERRIEEQRRVFEADRNSAQYEQAALDALSRIATTRQERNEIERRILASMEREEVAQLEAEIAAGRIADAQQARADLATAQGARRTYAERSGESPIEQRRREVQDMAADMGDVLEKIELGAIDQLTDGIADASTEFIKLGGVAGDVINGIIKDLIRMSIMRAIFGSSGGGSGGGLLGSIGKVLGFSSGGYTGDGPKDQVAGVVHRGEYVVPADTVRRVGVSNLAALANTQAARSMIGASVASPAAQQTGAIRVAITLDNDLLTARVQEASVPVAIEVVRQSSPGMVKAAQAATLTELGRRRM